MNSELSIVRVYEDSDLVEVAVTACNGLFAGSVNSYVNHGELEEAANHFRGFPTNNSDVRVVDFGTFDPASAGGGVSLRFFCVDGAGHVRLQLKLQDGSYDVRWRQNAEFFANVEPAAIDDFVLQLREVSYGTRREAILRFADPVFRS